MTKERNSSIFGEACTRMQVTGVQKFLATTSKYKEARLIRIFNHKKPDDIGVVTTKRSFARDFSAAVKNSAPSVAIELCVGTPEKLVPLSAFYVLPPTADREVYTLRVL